MKINFERLVSRKLAIRISKMLELSGIKISVNRILSIAIILGIILFIFGAIYGFYILKFGAIISVLLGIAFWGALIFALFTIIEFRIDSRKTTMENILPDYFQLASANLRSGIALDRALLLAARPEFGLFSKDIQEMSRRLFSGETLENSLRALSDKYNSLQLKRSVRMMIESIRYGGAMADLFQQLAKDLRAQQLTQKEVAGQMLMYSIFIAFAALAAAPVLYGLTTQMITITDNIWNGILAQNPGGLPSTGISFLKPSPPKITPGTYYDFSLVAIMIICGSASFIMSSMNSGSLVRGLRTMPLFIVLGLGVFFIVSIVIQSLFSGLGAL